MRMTLALCAGLGLSFGAAVGGTLDPFAAGGVGPAPEADTVPRDSDIGTRPKSLFDETVTGLADDEDDSLFNALDGDPPGALGLDATRDFGALGSGRP